MEIYCIWLCVINVLAFVLYGVDKWKAKRQQWRIPESVLLGVAVLGGGLGAFTAMRLFRHKTRHLKFRVTVPLFLVAHVVVLVFLAYVR